QPARRLSAAARVKRESRPVAEQLSTWLQKRNAPGERCPVPGEYPVNYVSAVLILNLLDILYVLWLTSPHAIKPPGTRQGTCEGKRRATSSHTICRVCAVNRFN